MFGAIHDVFHFYIFVGKHRNLSMNRIFAAALCAVVFAACTSNQKPKQTNTPQQQSSDSVQTEFADSTATPSDQDDFSIISCEVFKFLKKNNVQNLWLDLLDDNIKPDDLKNYSCWTNEPPTEQTTHYSNTRYWARPVNGRADKLWSCYFVKRDNGYVVIVDACSSNPDNGQVTVTNEGCYYIDGRISFTINDHGTTRQALPKPDLSVFYSNADKFPKEARDCLANSPLTYKFYINYTDNSISVTLNPYIGTILPDAISGLANKSFSVFPYVLYHWDGDNYIIDSKHTPYEEDLRYFESDGGKFAASGYRPEQLYDNYYEDLISESDINGDGFKDLVINDKDYKEFAVYFRDNHGAYNRKFVARRADSDGDLVAHAVNDTLYVSASMESTKEYVFHYQDSNFYLLNYSQSMCWDEGGCEYFEIDYLKHTITNTDDERDTTYSVPAYPLLKLSDVPLGWYTITDIYDGCDMIDIWNQLERMPDDAAGEKDLKYSKNHFTYDIDVNDSHCVRTRSIQCFELSNGKGYKVIDIYKLACETWSGIYSFDENQITEYTYSNGKLTKNKLQKSLKPYSKEGYDAVFDDNGQKISFLTSDGSEDVLFWNGEEFEKQ